MKIIKNGGSFTVLSTWVPNIHSGIMQIIEKAGRVCYQSERKEITSDTAYKFIKRAIKNGHYSVLEHGWRGYVIQPNPGVELFSYTLKWFWPVTKFLYITCRDDGSILVSANIETWRKIFYNYNLGLYSKDIQYDLLSLAPVIFECMEKPSNRMTFPAVPILSEDQFYTDKEKLVHIAHTVQYNDVSRGFTHELVRHRKASFCQESTRYINAQNIHVVLPPHRDSNDSIIQVLNSIESTYSVLRNSGWKAEDARQILPIGLKSQIVMTCNLEERAYIYSLRTAPNAHWEIRSVLSSECEFFSGLYPFLKD